MTGNQMINDRSSVAYSPTINLPQINSDNDNSVGARSSTRETLIINANVRSRARDSSLGKTGSVARTALHHGTIQRYAVVLRPIHRILA